MLELLFFEKELLDLKKFITFVVFSNFLLSFELYIYIIKLYFIIIIMLLILELKYFGKTTFGHKNVYYYCRLQ